MTSLTDAEANATTFVYDNLDRMTSETNELADTRTYAYDLVGSLTRMTGARPGELRHAEAFNYEKGKLIFRWNTTKGYWHKSASKTQRDRVIFLTPEVREYVEKLVKKSQRGPVFRTPRGAPWSLTSLSNKWTWLLKRPKVVEHCKEHGIELRQVRLYNVRHTWASNYPDATGDVFGAALMLGTSVKMLQTRYFHMDMDKLHERYLRFMGSHTVNGET